MISLTILTPLVVLILLNLPFPRLMRKIARGTALLLFLGETFLGALEPFGLWTLIPDPLNVLANVPIVSDALSGIMLAFIGLISLVALIVGQAAFQTEDKRFNFISLLLIAVTGLNGIVLAGDFFTLYVFVEVAAVASFVLIAFQRTPDAIEGAFKYVILSAVAGICMLTGLALLLMISGATSYEAAAAALRVSEGNFLARLGIGIFLCGLLIKGGLAPFHGWVPDAYSSAPAPVSVFLAGIATKITGTYALIRILTFVFGFSAAIMHILLISGAISVVGGALAAVGQRDFKRMLAYSSISQVGYIVLGLGTGTALGLAAAIFHFINHAVFKAQLFINAAAVEQRTGTLDMDKMGGLGSRMPYTGVTSIIAFLSTAGVPPLSGFWSKLLIVVALWQSSHPTFAVIAILASILTLGYFLIMQRMVFFGRVAPGLEQVREASAGFVVPAVILATVTIGIGLGFSFVLEHYILPLGGLWH